MKKLGTLTIVVGVCAVASACFETLFANVRVRGVLESPEPCHLSVVPSVNYSASPDERKVRGEFSEKFVVQPHYRDGKFTATVKCGEVVKVTKSFEYTSFSEGSYDLGRIAP